MAKLSANGVELARLRGTSADLEYDETLEREYSVRSNGWVLKKSRFVGARYHRPTWSGWSRAFRWNTRPGALDYTIQTIQEHLEFRGYAVTVENCVTP